MRDPNRPLVAGGPVVRTLEALSAVSGLAAIVALVLTISLFSSRVDRASVRSDVALGRLQAVQQSRVQSAADTCRTLRAVIEQAYAPASKRITYHAVLIAGGHRRRVQIQFAPVAKGLAARVVKADGLTDCRAHARKQTRVVPRR